MWFCESVDTESATDCKIFLKSLRTSKFEMLSDQIKGNIDVLLLSEAKIDDSFLNGIF